MMNILVCLNTQSVLRYGKNVRKTPPIYTLLFFSTDLDKLRGATFEIKVRANPLQSGRVASLKICDPKIVLVLTFSIGTDKFGY
jgi:hypothetical protein